MSLITLAEFKLRVGLPAGVSPEDSAYQAALDDASAAILNEYDRDWGVATVTENRNYSYDGSGVLTIDDASQINSVQFQNGSILPATAWRAKREGPASVQVYSWIALPVIEWGSGSRSLGEMGFLQNLDRFIAQPGGFPELTTTVNAAYGWPTVPDDVKRAVAITAWDYVQTSPTGGQAGELASESVAEVARSWFAEQSGEGVGSPEPIPARARALLEAYRRGNGVR